MNLKRLAEISPIIGAFLIFIGYLKLELYYRHWYIDIANYLDFSEILLSFLNDINTVLFLTLMMLLQMTLGIATLITIDKKTKSMANKTQSETSNVLSDEVHGFIPKFDKAIEENHKSVVIVLLVLTAIFVILFLYYLNLIFLYVSFILFVQLLTLFLDKILGINDEKTLVQTSFVIILLGFTYCLAKYDIKQTEISDKKITLQSNSSKIISTDNNFIFLGKTNNYYFFFNKEKSQSVIIPETTILKVTTTN